jgi:hypothetical protein
LNQHRQARLNLLFPCPQRFMIARLSLRTGFGKLRDNEKATLRHLVFTFSA